MRETARKSSSALSLLICFATAVRKLQINELRNTVMLRLRRFNRMCSSTLSDTANRLRKTRKKKSSAVLLFSKRSPLSDFRRVKK